MGVDVHNVIPPSDMARDMITQRTAIELITMLRTLEHMLNNDDLDILNKAVMRKTRLWIIEEIEHRYDVRDAMDAWAVNVNTKLSYVEALIRALPDDAVA